ncbi:uncharacterized protein B0I36DRAFT_363232 [Microdochium trichocladiopsis]|uniref:Uncharacterized protein n=1 Tax=Microdochium trichocladiopsis TaxID=1682393 RepID=A0A9P8Y7W3_9PEZI|nr:uncharacterized protein B0I36DRAFT_363232 [Microdochium trichocladiopsis]KAH7031557.1 hypothetical protein B0I36DRAFT_363232 [Microdochium trichocladiopsis]
MSVVTITPTQFHSLRDKVVLVTGGSSGIGLATVQLLLSVGAKVVNVDQNEERDTKGRDATLYQFVRADVTSWVELRGAFEHTINTFGVVDHVFANAGIQGRATALEHVLDANGLLAEPDLSCLQVNLVGVVYTVKLALYYMSRKSVANSGRPGPGSIVLTASASSFQTFSAGDYTVAKHGVLGIMRSLLTHLANDAGPDGQLVPLRINCIAPSWTATGVVPSFLLEKAGVPYQSPDVVAQSALLLMADDTKHGHVLYSRRGKYLEMEQSFTDHTRQTLHILHGQQGMQGTEEDEMWAIMKAGRQLQAEAAAAARAGSASQAEQ